MTYSKVSSPNFYSRDGHDITAIVLHITDGSASSALSWLTSRKSQVSAHYLVSQHAPYIVQMVDEDKGAWHCGRVVRPTWKGYTGENPNKYTLGIEAVSPSSRWLPNWGQWTAWARLVKDLATKHNIPLNKLGIVNHNEIRADKTCPGKYFNRYWALILIKYVV